MKENKNHILSQLPSRRLLLSRILKLLVLISFVIILIPFLSSLSSYTNNEVKDISTQWVVTFPIKALLPGEVKSLSWSGGVFWIYKRTEKDIELLKSSTIPLRDRASENSDQPKGMMNQYRSFDKSLFVFVPLENKRGCQVRLYDGEGGVRFTEPCYASKYDAAGHLVDNSGHEAQKNLSVPKHIIEEGMLKIGIWVKKVE